MPNPKKAPLKIDVEYAYGDVSSDDARKDIIDEIIKQLYVEPQTQAKHAKITFDKTG